MYETNESGRDWLTFIEQLSAEVTKRGITLDDAIPIVVRSEIWQRRHPGKTLFLVTLVYRQQYVRLSILADHEPTLLEALSYAFAQPGDSNSESLYALFKTRYTALYTNYRDTLKSLVG